MDPPLPYELLALNGKKTNKNNYKKRQDFLLKETPCS